MQSRFFNRLNKQIYLLTKQVPRVLRTRGPFWGFFAPHRVTAHKNWTY